MQNSFESVAEGDAPRRVAAPADQIEGVLRDEPVPPATEAAVGRLAARTRGVVGAYSDVAVHRSSLAREGFDARFSAVWRRYAYRVADATNGLRPARAASHHDGSGRAR